MYNISSKHDLEEAILVIENEVEEQHDLLTDHLRLIYESYKPVNIVRDVFKEVVTSDELRSNIITAAMGLSTGYLTKKIFFGKSRNPIKSLLGYFLQYGVANTFINPSRILSTILAPFQKFFDSKEESKTFKKKS
jgi:hypothetical protein